MAAPAALSTSPAASLMTGPNAGSKLASLPEELLSNIAVKLGSDDIFSLRLTCRDVEAKCLHEFANEYFASKCFMFTTESLTTFVNIAKSTKLRGRLHNVAVITAGFPERTASCAHGSCCCLRPTVRQREAFLYYMKDQVQLKKTKKDRALLTEALRELPGLRKLRLVDHPSTIPTINQTVWGLNKIFRTTSKSPAYAPVDDQTQLGYYPFLSHVWNTLLHAVADSGISSLTTFETRLKCHMHGISPITDMSFKQDTLNNLAVSFAKLETVWIQFRSQYMRKSRADLESDLTKAMAHIKLFAPVFKSATTVRLSSDYLDWSGALCNTMTNALDLKKLKSLAFDSIYIDGKTLGLVVSHLSSVEALTFHAIDLKSSSWATILKILQKLPKLNHLHLQLLQQATQKVYFLQQPDQNEGDPALDFPAWIGGGLPDDEDDENWTEDDDESDDEPPYLIPQADTSDIPALEVQNAPSSAAAIPEKLVNTCPCYTGKDFKAPGCDSTPERGYYVCLATREDIEEQLPNFIADCNLGESYDDLGLNGLLAMAGLPPNAVGGGIGGGPIAIPVGPANAVGQGAGTGADFAAAPPPPPPGNNAGPPPHPNGLNALTAALNAMLGPGGPPPQVGPHGISFSIPIDPGHHHHPPIPNAPAAQGTGNPGQAPSQTQATPGASHAPFAAAVPGSALAAGGHNGGHAAEDGEVPDLWMNDDMEPDWVNDVD